ncbi:MAG TPA: arginine deiminase family protein [Acidimicrobiia bacterium]|nr:arginine deiminase family protein [Acidimicrobiia bacterium]
MTTALVRRPGPRLAEGLLTHLERTTVDYPKALDQWHAYVAVLEANGWKVDHVDPADDRPDAVFVEDTVVVFGDLAVITRPGADERKPEIAGTEAAIGRHLTDIVHITAPATLDGGDVLKVGSTVYVGLSERTNPSAVDQLARLLPDRNVTAVPVTKVLHLKSAVTALPDGTVIGHEPVVDEPAMFGRFLGVPEESGSAVVDLEGGRLLMSADCPRSVEVVRARRYDVVTVDISEFQKLEGCVTCLSVRIR